MFDDVGKTIKAILYDRITSPLFSTFLLSWCGWNWRMIVLFLTDSSTTVAKKFLYIDTELYPSNGVTFIYGLLLPLSTTAFFIYIYPWFAKKVYGYWREQQNELKRLQVKKDGEKPLTNEEAQEITSQALLSELRYQEEREKREARIRSLEELVKNLQEEKVSEPIKSVSMKDLADRIERISPIENTKPKRKAGKVYEPDVEKGMLSILELIENLPDNLYVDRESVYKLALKDSYLSTLSRTLVRHCVDNLLESSLIYDTGTKLIVQAKGREALVKGSFE